MTQTKAITPSALTRLLPSAQSQHGQDDPSLALAHVQLRNGTRLAHQQLGHLVLGGTDLQLTFNFKGEPLGVGGNVPGAVNLQLLLQQQQQQQQQQQSQ
jgi:hypothetical protein